MTSLREAIGIDLGGTNLRVARVDQDGRVKALRSERVASGRVPQLQRLHALTRELAALEATPGMVSGIGVGIAGRIRQKDGQILSAGFLDLAGVPLRGIMEDEHRVPVVVDNDAHMAMTAEMEVGAATGCRDVVMFTIGTGIGGAVVTEGAIYYGHGIAGQLGHLSVAASGPVCRCGRMGCVETFSSGAVLNAYMAEAGIGAGMKADDLLAMAQSGDQLAADVLERWVTPLARAIDSVMAALDPELIVLGGGLGHVACQSLMRIPLSSDWFRRPIAEARLGDSAGVVGAALRALAATSPTERRGVPVGVSHRPTDVT